MLNRFFKKISNNINHLKTIFFVTSILKYVLVTLISIFSLWCLLKLRKILYRENEEAMNREEGLKISEHLFEFDIHVSQTPKKSQISKSISSRFWISKLFPLKTFCTFVIYWFGQSVWDLGENLLFFMIGRGRLEQRRREGY